MYLKHISLAGFRGAYRPLEIPMDKQTILFGPNGSGKTTVLQAITWAIYGKYPLFSGAIFVDEDALVNDFVEPAKAEVRLMLSDGTTITRTRKKQSSTTRGANPLSLSFQANDPQGALEELIGLDLDEFSAAVHLHQETIRDFLTTSPEERSATIDRMIGTHLLRTLIKVVDPKVPNAAIVRSEERIENLERQLSQASIMSRQMIRERKEKYGDPRELPDLLRSLRQEIAALVRSGLEVGLAESESTAENLETAVDNARHSQMNAVSGLESEIGNLEVLKSRYVQATETSWEPVRQHRAEHGDPAELPDRMEVAHSLIASMSAKLSLPEPAKTAAAMQKWLSSAHSRQVEMASDLEAKAGRLDALRERYAQAVGELVEEEAVPSALIDRQKKLREQADELNKHIARLQEQFDQLKLNEKRLAELHGEIQELDSLRQIAQQIDKEIEEVEAAEERSKLYDQLIATARDYLKHVRPDHCPVCKQTISNLQAVTEELEAEIPSDMAGLRARVTKLREDQKRQRAQIARLEGVVAEVDTLASKVKSTPVDIAAQIATKGKERDDLNNQMSEVETEIGTYEARIRQAEDNRRRMEIVVQEIEQEVGRMPAEDVVNELDAAAQASSALGLQIRELDLQGLRDMLDRIRGLEQIAEDEARLREQVATIEAEIATKLEASANMGRVASIDAAVTERRQQIAVLKGLDFDGIGAKLNRAKQLDQIQRDERRLEELEKEQQTASQERTRLEHQINRLTKLRDALLDISQTTKEHQELIVLGALNALDISYYYRLLQPHPVYEELSIEPELTTRGTYNYWLKALTRDWSHGTHVETRFLNCAGQLRRDSYLHGGEQAPVEEARDDHFGRPIAVDGFRSQEAPGANPRRERSAGDCSN